MNRVHVRSTFLCAAALSLAACDSAPVVAGSDVPPAEDAMAQPDAMVQPDATGDVVVPPTDGPAPMMADWGFRPNPNGFNFQNFGTSRPGEMPETARLDADLLRRIFGPTVCVGMNAMGPCVLVPTARQWMDTENNGANGGNCEGFTVLAGHMYAGGINPMTFGGPNAFGLMRNNTLERELVLWAVSQTTANEAAPMRRMEPREMLTHLTSEFNRGRMFLGTTLAVFGRQGGHAILPYAIRRMSDTLVHVMVYDNNHPDSERFLAINPVANTWSYRAALNPSMPDDEWTGTGMTNPMGVRDHGPRLMFPHPSDAWQNRQMDGGGMTNMRINTVGESQVTVTDAMMRSTSVSADGVFQENIPGSRVSLRMPGRPSRPDPVFTVPRATPITVTLDGTSLTAASPTELLFQGQGWTLGLDGVSIDPMQRDTLVIQPGQPDLLYRAAGAETPTLSLAFQAEGDDYLIELRARSMNAGQNLRLAVDFAMNRARISFDGSTTAPMFELYVDRVSASGDVVFEHDGVTAMPNSVMYVNFGSWGGNNMPMSIGYDDNGDGTIDRTAPLSDDP
jgi:hypothetical protein